MFATVRRYEGVTDSAECARRVKDGFVPLISEMEGFIAYYFIDAGDGVMLSTSVFATREEEEASNQEAAGYVRENLAELLPNAPRVMDGHVVATKTV